MMAITHSDISTDEDLGRRVLVRARIIAPCLDSLEEGSEEMLDAIAVLKGVIAELPAPGSKNTTSLSRNGSSMSFRTIDAAFDADARASLRSLCGLSAAPGLPMGSFPVESAIGRVWPEGDYS